MNLHGLMDEYLEMGECSYEVALFHKKEKLVDSWL